MKKVPLNKKRIMTYALFEETQYLRRWRDSELEYDGFRITNPCDMVSNTRDVKQKRHYWAYHRYGKPAVITDIHGDTQYKICWYAYGKIYYVTEDYCNALGFRKKKL